MPDIILRASASRYCNFSCIYCPKDDWASGGMENYSPGNRVGEFLTCDEYKETLKLLRDGLDIRKVSFTGGEPTLNSNLLDILRAAKKIYDKVEITTNGSLLSKGVVSSFENLSLDQVKVSLDSIDPREFMEIVGKNSNKDFNNIISGVHTLTKSTLSVALNVIVMKRNLRGLRDLIRFAESIKCQVHLLDYVFYPSKRADWEEQYVPIKFLAEELTSEYGNPRKVIRYGCSFYELDVGNIFVRFKDSRTATVRAKSCQTCDEYCQEGPYGLKLSVEGWVTPCPSVSPRKGVAVSPHLTDREVSTRLASLIPMFTDTQIDEYSFEKFLKIRRLHPMLSQTDVRSYFKRNAKT